MSCWSSGVKDYDAYVTQSIFVNGYIDDWMGCNPHNMYRGNGRYECNYEDE
jgi:hypothetical protein